MRWEEIKYSAMVQFSQRIYITYRTEMSRSYAMRKVNISECMRSGVMLRELKWKLDRLNRKSSLVTTF